MPRKANESEIVVEWLESRDKGKRHRVNVEHIIECLEEVEVQREVTVKLKTGRYKGMVVDLLDWAPPKKKRRTKESVITVNKICIFSFSNGWAYYSENVYGSLLLPYG